MRTGPNIYVIYYLKKRKRGKKCKRRHGHWSGLLDILETDFDDTSVDMNDEWRHNPIPRFPSGGQNQDMSDEDDEEEPNF